MKIRPRLAWFAHLNPRRHPTILAAVGFFLLAAVATVAYFLTSNRDARAWLPNIAASLGTLAITVSAIDVIVRRETRLRAAPRYRRLYQDIDAALASFGWDVANEYSDTHDAQFTPITSTKLHDVLRHWLAGSARADLEPSDERIISGAETLANALDRQREQNIDVLGTDAAFFVTMDECARELRSHGVVIALIRALNAGGGPGEVRALNLQTGTKQIMRMRRKIVEAVDHFAAEFEGRAERTVVLKEELLDVVNLLHEQEMERRGLR